jgi:hypothetical protein
MEFRRKIYTRGSSYETTIPMPLLFSTDKKKKYIAVLVTVILLFIITIMTFERILPSSFQTITGDVISRVNVTQPLAANCNFTLYSGFNLVSFFCITTMTPRNDVIFNLTDMESIFEYEEEATDVWKSYNPSLPSFVIQDLHYMTRTKGYWIKMRADQNLFLEGDLRIPSYVYLKSGWNLAGYPTSQIKPVNTSFSTIDGNFTVVRAFDPQNKIFIAYVPGVGGALNQTEPYRGYWINATTDEVWVID